MGYFNTIKSSFTPPSGRDSYLDFYIDAITKEILHGNHQKQYISNISKDEIKSLFNLMNDDSIVIKKADKSNTIIIMNQEDYVKEVERQLNEEKYYQHIKEDPSMEIKSKISTCINEIAKNNNSIYKEFDTFPLNIRTPQFYILPKTHKNPDHNLPLNYPGRPIISGCNSYTENLSKFIDSVLQPLMKSLPSYIKDTTDFIKKLKSIPQLSDNSILVSLDVTSLYTNIPHTDGIEACKYFLDNNPNNSTLSSEDICKIIKLILENNYFQFNNKNYIQIMGTAMGSPMAPSYASLFMGKLEKDFLQKEKFNPSVWFRFLDDIFMIWNHSTEELEKFIDRLNHFHPTIKFTYTASSTHVSFLDVNVIKNIDNTISTNIHVKETNIHQYVEYSSCHPMSCKNGIPYSQAKRYRRIISDDCQLQNSLNDLKRYFQNRNYPTQIIDSALNKTRNLTQHEALNTAICTMEKNIVPFTIQYNPSLPNIGLIINKYWSLLNLSNKNSVKSLYNNKPILAYRRPKNLQDFLIRTKQTENKKRQFSSSKCNRHRCSQCANIRESVSFSSANTKETFSLRYNTNCVSTDVIYLITCKKCNMQYVGQTLQQVSKRMNNHRFHIKNYRDPQFSSNISTHFNTNNHCLLDFSFMPIDVVHGNMNRLMKETYWIHKLDTLYPNGLNTNALYKIV